MPRFVRENGTNQKKEWTQGRNPASKKLLVRWQWKDRGGVVIWWKKCWHNFWGANCAKICWKNSPFSRNSSPSERKRLGWGREIWTECHKWSDGDYIAWIKFAAHDNTLRKFAEQVGAKKLHFDLLYSSDRPRSLVTVEVLAPRYGCAGPGLIPLPR